MTLFGRVFSLWIPKVRLRPIKHLTTDLRRPKDAFLLRHKWEQRGIV